jgi:hypothetical protein
VAEERIGAVQCDRFTLALTLVVTDKRPVQLFSLTVCDFADAVYGRIPPQFLWLDDIQYLRSSIRDFLGTERGTYTITVGSGLAFGSTYGPQWDAVISRSQAAELDRVLEQGICRASHYNRRHRTKWVRLPQ